MTNERFFESIMRETAIPHIESQLKILYAILDKLKLNYRSVRKELRNLLTTAYHETKQNAKEGGKYMDVGLGMVNEDLTTGLHDLFGSDDLFRNPKFDRMFEDMIDDFSEEFMVPIVERFYREDEDEDEDW